MKFLFFLLASLGVTAYGQVSPFEKSGGKETATYFEAIDWYQSLGKKFPQIQVKTMGSTDAGYPLHLVLISSDGRFDPGGWHQQGKVVILINNGIHPGEPDGIDASMMLARDIALNKIVLPKNVALAIIPVYNIGGALNRNAYTRANQNGPVSYGFRGNAQNLDLNRDFTKADSKNAASFAGIFHYVKPDIQVDNHVSDGADFQHVMTLISTQYDKLGYELGNFLKQSLEPALYKKMAEKKWDMVPYVDFATTDFDKGMQMFMDPPRYSSGYAALFNTISFMPETHMLKPYDQRVKATYDLEQTFIEVASAMAANIIQARTRATLEWQSREYFPLKWQVDSSSFSSVTFKGYEIEYGLSEATGLKKMFYDHRKPFSKPVIFYDHYVPIDSANIPSFYVIPQGWWKVIERLRENGVKCTPLSKDSIISVSVSMIKEFKSYPTPYEGHHKNYAVSTQKIVEKLKFLKGDYLVPMRQPQARYIMEMLEPTGDDSFFAWNFFDPILQQKEGYSDYRWEDLAAEELKRNQSLQDKLAAEKANNPEFARNSRAILNFIYKNSKYAEAAYMRYPVYRIE